MRYKKEIDVFQKEKNPHEPFAHLRLSGQNRPDGSVGSAQGAEYAK